MRGIAVYFTKEYLMERLIKLMDLLEKFDNPPSKYMTRPAGHPWLGQKVIIRTDTAGVHYGVLDFVDGKICRLKNSRRFWSWEGAFTLSEIALTGPDKPDKCRFSKSVPDIQLEWIEILPCEDAGIKVIDSVKPYEYK